MKALIERSLYRPTIVLPILALVRLMTALDFSLTQIVLVLTFKGTRYVFNAIVAGTRATLTPSSRTGSELAVHTGSLLAPQADKTRRECHCVEQRWTMQVAAATASPCCLSRRIEPGIDPPPMLALAQMERRAASSVSGGHID